MELLPTSGSAMLCPNKGKGDLWNLSAWMEEHGLLRILRLHVAPWYSPEASYWMPSGNWNLRGKWLACSVYPKNEGIVPSS